jgi:glycerol-3-phosphate acyltransferase PlsX
MATAYAQATYGIKTPKVGLLNNGTEDHKGDLVHQEANALLKEVPCIDYMGNVEGRDIMYSEADVVVADGFTGNIAMKAIEGCGKTVSSILKKQFKKNIFNMLRYLLVKDIVGGIRSALDYERIGGAMFLGMPKAVVKGHGNSKAKGFAACIAQAADAVRGGMVDKIKTMLQQLEEQSKQQESAATAPEQAQ